MEIEKRIFNIELALTLNPPKSEYCKESKCGVAFFDGFFRETKDNQKLLPDFSFQTGKNITSAECLDSFTDEIATEALRILMVINDQNKIDNLRVCWKKFTNELGEFCYKKHVDINDLSNALSQDSFKPQLFQVVKTFLSITHPHFNPLTNQGLKNEQPHLGENTDAKIEYKQPV